MRALSPRVRVALHVGGRVNGGFEYFYRGRARRLLIPVSLFSAESTIDTVALLDTGATQSCISEEIAVALKGTPMSSRRALTPAAGAVYLPVYQVNLELPNAILIPNLEVMGVKLGVQGIGMLVGMDILTLGQFSVSFDGARTRLSFSLQHVR